MKVFKNKNVVTILAGIICVIIIGFAYKYRVNKAIRAVSVPVAKNDILARTEIDDSMFVINKEVPSSALTNNVIRDVNRIKGYYVNYNTFIPKGSFFYSNAVVTWDAMPDSAWADIKNDDTIVSLNVNNITTYGNSIFPGDKIDIYYRTSDKGLLVLGKLVEGITVLAVKDSDGNHIMQKSAEQRTAAALIFSVPEELHLLLKKAQYLNGDLIPVPRNTNYSSDSTITTNISSDYLVNLIESKCLDIPLDSVDTNTITE